MFGRENGGSTLSFVSFRPQCPCVTLLLIYSLLLKTNIREAKCVILIARDHLPGFSTVKVIRFGKSVNKVDWPHSYVIIFSYYSATAIIALGLGPFLQRFKFLHS